MVDVADLDKNKCQEYGCTYDEDEHPEAWINYDKNNCGQWFYYWRAGLYKLFISKYCYRPCWRLAKPFIN